MLFTFIASSPGGGVGPENRYTHSFSYYFQLITCDAGGAIPSSARARLLGQIRQIERIALKIQQLTLDDSLAKILRIFSKIGLLSKVGRCLSSKPVATIRHSCGCARQENQVRQAGFRLDIHTCGSWRH
jgi:hypothetical protein